MNRFYIDVKALVALALSQGVITTADLVDAAEASGECEARFPVGYACAYGATPSVFIATDRETQAPKLDRNGKLGLNVSQNRKK